MSSSNFDKACHNNNSFFIDVSAKYLNFLTKSKSEKNIESNDSFQVACEKEEKVLTDSEIPTTNIFWSIYSTCNTDKWDGENAIAISEQTIYKSIKALSVFKECKIDLPDIVPTPLGDIDFYWEIEINEKQYSILFSVNDKGYYEFIKRSYNDMSYKKMITGNFDEINLNSFEQDIKGFFNEQLL